MTARPSAEEEAASRIVSTASAPRHSPAASRGGVRRALAAMSEAHAAGRLPILTGGSGLYFAALTDGLAEIPDPGSAARAEARRLLAEQGSAALHASLRAR